MSKGSKSRIKWGKGSLNQLRN